MYDNKYLYFNNLVYSYITIGHSRVNMYDKEILLITLLDIFTNQFKKNLGWMMKKYMLDYRIKDNNLLYYNNIPSLKKISIYTIQRHHLNHKVLCHHLQLQITYPLWSVSDTNTHIVSFFRNLHNKDNSKLLDYLIRIYKRASS